MKTTEEAVAYFRSLGFFATLFDYPVEGAVRVAGRLESVSADIGYEGGEMHVLQHQFVLFPDGRSWVVRDANWQVDVDQRFTCLEAAVNALATHLSEWRASGRRTTGPGL